MTNPKVTACGKNLSNILDFNISSSTAWTSKLKSIKDILPGTYTISFDCLNNISLGTTVGVSVREYENPGVFYGEASMAVDTSGHLSTTFTIPDGSMGVWIYFYSNFSSAAQESNIDFYNIQIEKGENATEFEPYQSKTATLSDIALCSAGEAKDRVFKDADGLWKIERNIGEADLGTLDWIYESGGTRFYSNTIDNLIKPNSGGSVMSNCICSKLKTTTPEGTWNGNDNVIAINCYNANNVLARVTSFGDDINAFKAAMLGAILYYELATPTYETLPDSIQAELNSLTTYNPVTNVMVSDGVTPDIDVSFWTRDKAAKEEAAAAAKVATNFLNYDSTNGLIMGNKISGSWSGYRSQMLPTAFNILDASGNTLSSYGTVTTIGKTSGQHVYIDSDSLDIKNGTTVLATFSGDTLKCGGNFSVDKTGKMIAKSGTIGGFTIASTSLMGYGNWVKLNFVGDSDGTYSNEVVLYADGLSLNRYNDNIADYDSQCWLQNDVIKLTAGSALQNTYKETNITWDGENINISGDLTVTGQIISTGRHTLANNTSVSFLNSSGTRVRGIALGNTDNILIGADSNIAGMYGYITAQNNIVFYAGTSHDQCFASIYDNGKRYFQSKPIYDRTTSSGTAVRVNSNGTLYRYSSSSMRYKEEITCQLSEELNPERLYDLNVWQYKYREGHLDKDDQRYGKTHIGLIAEDVKQHYPIAANFNEDGDVEDWSERYLIPPMLKLIQMQHEEIELIKAELERIRNAE